MFTNHSQYLTPFILVSFLLGIIVAIISPIFILITIFHLVIFHKYGYSATFLSLVSSSLGTLGTYLLLHYSWINSLGVVIPSALFTLTLIVPVKRRLHTILILGIFSGFFLIFSSYHLLNTELFMNKVLIAWNSLTPKELNFSYTSELQTEILYSLSSQGVSFAVKTVAFIWFISKWISEKTIRINFLSNFKISKPVFYFLIFFLIAYVALIIATLWFKLAINGRITFIWSNVFSIALFLFFLEGLATILIWTTTQKWKQSTQENFAMLLLIISATPITVLSTGVQLILGVIGVKFFRQRKIV